MKNGYKCISDDLIFYDIKNDVVVPYFKPIGIRSTSMNISDEFKNIYNSINDIPHKSFLNKENNVITKIFHLDDLFLEPFLLKNTKINNIFYICEENIKELNFGDRINLIEKGCCNSNLDSYLKINTIIKINNMVDKIEYVKGKSDIDELLKKI